MASTAGPSASSAPPPTSTPILAQGDWTKNLVHLAKTAELKKHALTLQLHTAHILSAHASLDQKNKAIQDLKEQKNRLESERSRLLNCLREVNEDRDKADMLEATLNKECSDLQTKIHTITNGEYATAKSDVDRLRQELGQPALPSIQATLEEKSAQYLKELRLQAEQLATSTATTKRTAEEVPTDGQPTGKRPRGRPKGSKTKPKTPAPNATPNSNANTSKPPTTPDQSTTISDRTAPS
ncbi:hypothetical protein QCA50_003688 [Cerrena zonata]|uniref:Uncharacterized protein n=1 Tax=Cerrena zonata TaxID=2478898 RepID=A0AAW0GQC9_9APHY